MIANRDMFVIRQKRLIGTEELADSRGVMNGSVEVSVIRYIDGPDERRSCDGMKGFFQLTLMRRVGRKKPGKGFMQEQPCFWAFRHQSI